MLFLVLQNLLVIVILSVLEPIESIDNALYLIDKASDLPAEKKMPWPFHQLLKMGQRDGILRAGIWCDYFWRISLFFILTNIIKYVIVGVLMNVIGGGYLVYKTIEHFFPKSTFVARIEKFFDFLAQIFSRKNDRLSPVKDNLIGSNAYFWKKMIDMEIANIIFGLDSFATAWAFTHNFPILLAATVIGVAFVRLGLKWARPIVMERYPRLIHGAYILIGVVGFFLLLDIPLKFFFLTETPEAVKVSFAFVILIPFIIVEEHAYRNRMKEQRAADLDRRVPIEPSGPIYDGYFIRRIGYLYLQLARERVRNKTRNTMIALDGSLSRADWFSHFFWLPSKYERILRYIGPAVAQLDSDGACDVIICSLGSSGNEWRHLGTFTSHQFAHIKVPDNLDYGEKTDLLTCLNLSPQLLGREGVNRFEVVVLSDGVISDQHFADLQQEGYHRVQKTTEIDDKTTFIVEPSVFEQFYSIDNLPGTVPTNRDPFQTLSLASPKQAKILSKKIGTEALNPQTIATIDVGDRARIFVGNNVYHDTSTKGVYGQLEAFLPGDTTTFVLEIDGNQTTCAIPS